MCSSDLFPSHDMRRVLILQAFVFLVNDFVVLSFALPSSFHCAIGNGTVLGHVGAGLKYFTAA